MKVSDERQQPSLVPQGALKELAQELREMVRGNPAAKRELRLRLLNGGE